MAADLWHQVKSIVLGNVRMLRTTLTMEIYLVGLLPPRVPKSPIACSIFKGYIINHSTIRKFVNLTGIKSSYYIGILGSIGLPKRVFPHSSHAG